MDAYHFLPWVRYGVTAGLSNPDPLGAGVNARAPVPIRLRLHAAGPGTSADQVVPAPELRLYGPGDVIGIDPREVVRTTPRHLTPDFPHNLLASIEFDRPDFPWLFTPAAPNQDRLRPWIVLAVVRKQAATLATDSRRPLPVLECPVSELPDLTDSWRWAHAQFAGDPGQRDLSRVLADHPHQNVSRLLCPRQLALSSGGPDQGYYACVVPAFDVGRRAGLGEQFDTRSDDTLAPAWEIGSAGPITLPVYYVWEFSAGLAADFEQAVDQLRFITTWPAAAPRVMDVSQPREDLPSFSGARLGIPSALWPGGVARPAEPDALPTIRDDLSRVLEQPQGSTPWPSPPVYGQWQAGGDPARPTAPPLAAQPAWVRDLNADPRYRVVAALGAQIVQQQQEQLVAAAWEQAGQVEAVNQWLRQKELAREVSQSVYDRRLKKLSESSLAQILSPVVAPPEAGPPTPTSAVRLAATTAVTPASPAAPVTAALMDAVVSPSFRRISRPDGPLGRPTAATAAPAVAAPPVGEMTTLVRSIVVGNVAQVQVALPSLSRAGDGAVSPQTVPTAPATGLLNRLDPALTYAREVAERVQVDPRVSSSQTGAVAMRAASTGAVTPIKPAMVSVNFPQPMSVALRDLLSDVLLPGLERIPSNSVTLLAVDGAFIEAYMVGLNDALSRELLWREFPARLQDSYFRQFWDVRGQLPAASTPEEQELLYDMPHISQWRGRLGANLKPDRGGGGGLMMLLIKGDLLVRFPTALIFAARGQWTRDANNTAVWPPVVDDSEHFFPVLRISPSPGVALLGFSLKEADGAPVTSDTIAGGAPPSGRAGWFFVFAEHPTEPRFGLDIPPWEPAEAPRPVNEPLNTWRELTWRDVVTRADGSGYIDRATATAPSLVAPPQDAPPTVRARYEREKDVGWGTSAAHMAYITLQPAFRQEIHAGFWFAD